jgi:hypothetical protein
MKPESYLQIVKELEDELYVLKIEPQKILFFAERATGLCSIAFHKLKELVRKEGFESINDEIIFFKTIKPKVFSKLIYFSEIYRLESRRPPGGKKFQKKFLNHEFKKLQDYFEEHHEFFHYYRTTQTGYDQNYYVRNANNIFVGTNINYHYLLDRDFSTSHDEHVAHFMAFEQLEKYIEDELAKLKRLFGKQISLPFRQNRPSLEWTGKIVGMVELGYALDSLKIINYGKADVNDIILALAQAFNKKVVKPYRIFSDILGRKKEKTILLDDLKQALLKRIDDMDALTKS